MKQINKNTICFAFKKSIPILFGYLFLGLAYGIMLYDVGYNFIWAIFTSLVIYSGAAQFLLVSLLATRVSLPTVFTMSFLINSRHIFYGLSFIEKFKKGGWRYPFLIFSLTDETYSVNLTFNDDNKDIDDVKARFYLGIFNHLYWIIGSFLGSLIGQILPIDFTGIDFSMTALFVVIFIELLLEQKDIKKLVGPIGIIIAIISLLIFGPDKFILPTMLMLVAILLAMKPVFSKGGRIKL